MDHGHRGGPFPPACVALLLVLSRPGPAGADPSEVEPLDPNYEECWRELRQAQASEGQGRLAEARKHTQACLNACARDSPIARQCALTQARVRCREQETAANEHASAGRLRQARDLARQCAQACVGERDQRCEELAARTQAAIPTVLVRVSPSRECAVVVYQLGAGTRREVFRQRAAEWPQEVELDPGRYLLRAEIGNQQSPEQVVELDAGQMEVVLELVPEPKQPEVLGHRTAAQASDGPRPIGSEVIGPAGAGEAPPWSVWALGGIAVATAVPAAYFWVRARQQYDWARDHCRPGCPDDFTRQIRDKQLAGDVFGGAALGALAAGVVVTIVWQENERHRSGSRAALRVGPSSVGPTYGALGRVRGGTR